MNAVRMMLAVVVLLLGNPAAWAELTVTVKPAQVVATITPEIVTQITTAEGEPVGEPVRELGEPVVQPGKPAVVVRLVSDRDLERSLVKIKCRTAEAVLVSTGVYVVTTPGTHELDVNVISEQPLQWDDEQLTVTVGEGSGPDDPEPDDPEPDDPLPAPGLDELTRISRQAAPNDDATARLLVDYIQQTAANIDALCAATSCPSFDEARAAYQRAIGNALGSRPRGSQADWLPWRKALEPALKNYNVDTVEKLKAAMLAITKGL